MIFKNIAKAAARLLDKEDVAAHFDEPSSSDAVRREAELVARCVNLCIAQTAAEYAPFLAEETVEAPNGTVEFSALSHDAADIVSAEDLSGNRLKIKLYPGYFRTSPGTVKVRYSYYPEKFSERRRGVFRRQAGERRPARLRRGGRILPGGGAVRRGGDLERKISRRREKDALRQE